MADRLGSSSIDLAISCRLDWAQSRWLGPCNQIVAMLNGQSMCLHQWGVVMPTAVGGVASAPIVDQFLLETVEAMARSFVGLTARSLMLWQGGVYHMVMLLSDIESVRHRAVTRAQLLFPRMLALEQLLATPDCPQAVTDFGARYLWLHGTVYRELLGLLSEGHLDAARVYAWRVHGSVHHEKGLPANHQLRY
jgi:hypothetical protein